MNNTTTQNPIFAKFDQILGTTTPTTSVPQPTTRASEIRQLAKDNAPVQPPAPTPTLTDLGAAATENVAKPLANAEIGLAKDVGGRANNIADVVKAGIEKGRMLSPTEALQSGSKIAAETTGVIGDTVKRGMGALTDIISNIPALKDLANSKGVSAALDYVNNAGAELSDEFKPAKEALASWSAAHPQAADIIKSLGETGANLSIVAGGPKAGEMAGAGVDTAAAATKSVIGEATNTVKAIAKEGIPDVTPGIKTPATTAAIAPAVEKDLNTIQELISPKITSKETQKIINDSRLTRGKESVIFGKQPDIVEQSEAVKDAANIINEQIPNAAKMTDAQLATALDGKTTEIAKSLQTEMKQVPIKPETTGKVVEAYKKLKAEQAKTPDFKDHREGNEAFQQQFENHLKQLEWDITDKSGKFKAPTSKTMDDIWAARKSYDDSIPSNVKNATEKSAPVSIARKEMWLENRALLNAAIHDTADGMGDTSQKAFKDLSGMYDAKQNILSKAKVDLEGKKGILPSTFKGWATAGGVVLGGEYLLHKMGL